MVIASLPIQITVEEAQPTGVVSLPLAIEVASPTKASLPVQVTVYDASQFPGHNGIPSGGTFSVSVAVGGEDYTDRLTGEIRIDAEEGAARVAAFRVVVKTTGFEPDDWINLPVTIDLIQNGLTYRLFTGNVDLPDLSLTDESIALSCTDNLQGRFEAKKRELIEGLFQGTGAQWHPAVFGEYETSAQFAEDLLSTIPASADLDRDGQLVFGDWYLAGHDFEFSDDEVFPDSVTVEWGGRRDMINTVEVEIEYTYQYFRERKQRYVWEYPRSFEDYLQQNTSLPNSDMITDAAEPSGWQLDGAIQFERLPESGVYPLPGGGETNWLITDELRDYLTIGADFTIASRWVQDVRETHSYTLVSTPNVSRYGALGDEIRVTLDTSLADADGFEAYRLTPPLPQVVIGSDKVWTSRSAGGLEAVKSTVMAMASTKVLDSHRQSTVSFRTLIQPELERWHFVRLSHHKVTAVGKVRRFQHLINLDAGSALTEIDLAVFRGNVSAESIPATDTYLAAESERVTVTNLGSAIQLNDGSVATPADDFAGYVGNELPIVTSNPFEERFSILSEEIAETSRDPIEVAFQADGELVMYNQTLTVSF